MISNSSTTERIAIFGGVYSNYLALEAAIADAKSKGVKQMYCLGDLGAFGPYPNRVFPLLHQNNIQSLQGNYDDSIGNELDDCQCGYTDPRDNYFAQISYDYTLANTSRENRSFLKTLPKSLTISLGDKRILMCHGSPGRVNEFLWESTCSTQFLEKLLVENSVDMILATHTGIKWQRHCAAGTFVNVGVLGRPENDGTTNVWYTLIEQRDGALNVEFVPIAYDHTRLAREMSEEGLPPEFGETITTGWWTTCVEVLPVKERKRGQL